MRPRPFIVPLTLAFAVAGAGAQSSLPPIRQLGPVAATSKEPFTNISGVRPLPGGKVLVNEPFSRRVLLFDSTLTSFTVVADSTAATGNAYSGRIGGLIPYRSDSTLFVDAQSLSMLVIDPAGKVGRVMSVPRTQDVIQITGGGFGGAAFDGTSKLVYRGSNFAPIIRTAGGGPPQMPSQPDTAPVVRVDLATRVVDTVGFIKVPKTDISMSQDANGRMTVTTKINPLPVVDDWAMLADGSIGFVRGRDYHVDWVNADGSRSSSAKVPFEWQRLTDEDKAAFIDSVKAARERQGATAGVPLGAGQQIVTSFGGGRPGGPPPGGGGAGGGQRVMVFGGDGGRGGPGGPGGMSMAPPQINYVQPSELPDYKPPFFAGSVRPDAEGNLWIRTIPTKAYPGGPVYDVLNRKGEIIDRVQIPAGRQIVGFGPAGAVYMTSRDEANALTLERARATK